MRGQLWRMWEGSMWCYVLLPSSSPPLRVMIVVTTTRTPVRRVLGTQCVYVSSSSSQLAPPPSGALKIKIRFQIMQQLSWRFAPRGCNCVDVKCVSEHACDPRECACCACSRRFQPWSPRELRVLIKVLHYFYYYTLFFFTFNCYY